MEIKKVLYEWSVAIILLITIYLLTHGFHNAPEFGVWNFLFLASVLYLVVNFLRFKMKA